MCVCHTKSISRVGTSISFIEEEEEEDDDDEIEDDDDDDEIEDDDCLKSDKKRTYLSTSIGHSLARRSSSVHCSSTVRRIFLANARWSFIDW